MRQQLRKWLTRICTAATLPQLIIPTVFLYGWLKCSVLGKDDWALNDLCLNLYFYLTVFLPLTILYALLLATLVVLLIIVVAKRERPLIIQLVCLIINTLFLALLVLNAYLFWHAGPRFAG